jgi:hypothetical protein
MDENSRPRKQARLDTFLIPHKTRKVNGKLFSYELAEFRIQELFEPLFKEK